MITNIIEKSKNHAIVGASALPYFDNSVAIPDMLKMLYFDFNSHPPPQKK